MFTVAAAFTVVVVSGATMVTSPLTVSFVDGTSAFRESLPCPVADQLKSELPAVNVQVKLTDWPAARLPVKAVDASGALRSAAAIHVPAVVPRVAQEFVPGMLTLSSMS